MTYSECTSCSSVSSVCANYSIRYLRGCYQRQTQIVLWLHPNSPPSQEICCSETSRVGCTARTRCLYSVVQRSQSSTYRWRGSTQARGMSDLGRLAHKCSESKRRSSKSYLKKSAATQRTFNERASVCVHVPRSARTGSQTRTAYHAVGESGTHPYIALCGISCPNEYYLLAAPGCATARNLYLRFTTQVGWPAPTQLTPTKTLYIC